MVNIDKIASQSLNEYVARNTEPINEMARIRQRKSGLPMIVWLNPNDGTNTGRHNMPRLKFQDNTNEQLNPSNMVPISIHASEPTILVKNYETNLPSRVITMLKGWIIKNYNVLMAYWNNEIYEDELMDSLQSV